MLVEDNDDTAMRQGCSGEWSSQREIKGTTTIDTYFVGKEKEKKKKSFVGDKFTLIR
jgi:hypothetical protein